MLPSHYDAVVDGAAISNSEVTIRTSKHKKKRLARRATFSPT